MEMDTKKRCETPKIQHNKADRQKHLDARMKAAIKVDYYRVRGEYIRLFSQIILLHFDSCYLYLITF